MHTQDKILLTTTDRHEAERMAQSLPRPSMVRRHRNGSWAVVQIVPTPWRRERVAAPTLADLALRQQAWRPVTNMREKASA